MRSGRGALDVAVIGPGPAGVVTACALRSLGHTVTLIGRSRGVALEGLSPRAHALLGELSLHAAAASAVGPMPRNGRWASRSVSAGSEYVVDRARFDRALRDDARTHGVELQDGPVIGIERAHGAWRVHSRAGCLSARVLVDARGRRTRKALTSGPPLVAVSQALKLTTAAPAHTRIVALEDLWCWLVADGAGGATLQLTVAARRLARRGRLREIIEEALMRLQAAEAMLREAEPQGPARARAATARLFATAPAGPGYVCAGDAAVAMDPLSGHGIYEALAWGAAASAGAHTYLEGADWEPVRWFLDERARERWEHGIRLAAAFYREQGLLASTFWQETAATYAALLTPGPPADAPASWGLRPVLNAARIEMRRVVITPQRPRGVWHVDNVELERLCDFLRAAPRADLAQVAEHLGHDPAAVTSAMRWLRMHGLIGTRTASDLRLAGNPA